jgi:uncharacterized protein YdiU (UPF0061 family)
MADMAASYMVAGFVHGVLNSDNMNISGESFDYGPWRWLPAWDTSFTAAYFDHSGLYCFGRQPEAIHWNCAQLAVALRLLAETDPLIAALDRFGPLYQQAMVRRFLWRLGLESRRDDADLALVAAAEKHMLETGQAPDAFFHTHRAGRNPPADSEFGQLLGQFVPAGEDHPLWCESAVPTLVIDEVERLWSAIDQHDDWAPLNRKVGELRELGRALGTAPKPAGHI